MLPKVIPERFSLLFSMRMEAGSEEQQRQKQNILCETDAHGLNRHHFAVYVRHCKLELLLRREPEEASAEFRAAEWRWSDERICDGQWHRYGLLFEDLDNIKLTIDGEQFNASQRNPEILDDWPLHQVKDKVHNLYGKHNSMCLMFQKTRLVAGACWHGRQKQMVQHFNGYLAAMWLWSGRAHSTDSVKCVHGQHERLQLDAHLELAHGQSAHFANDKTSLHLRAQSSAELARLLRSVQFHLDPLYAADNAKRLAPSAREGQRRVQVTGNLMCANNVSRPLAPISAIVSKFSAFSGILCCYSRWKSVVANCIPS